MRELRITPWRIESRDPEDRSYRERSVEHTSELQSRGDPELVCRLLLEKKNKIEMIVII